MRDGLLWRSAGGRAEKRMLDDGDDSASARKGSVAQSALIVAERDGLTV
ncbi:MAG TPA: hypothetical protein VFX61_14980 [Micromonosporaceae bacterium]|nr:hypothetical protein [Micromonosporaceae bacterium]